MGMGDGQEADWGHPHASVFFIFLLWILQSQAQNQLQNSKHKNEEGILDDV